MEKEKLEKINELANLILHTSNLDEAIHHTADILKELMEVERLSIFLYDKNNDKVYTYRADYIDKIEMPANKGIVGYVIETKKPYISNNPYEDKYFNKEIDFKTGFTTNNILAVPFLDIEGRLLGVIEFINKKDDFNQKDIAFAKLYANYISEPLKMLIEMDK
jgi:transcriptional regulator with GAF, ATPase, and Fis domain